MGAAAEVIRNADDKVKIDDISPISHSGLRYLQVSYWDTDGARRSTAVTSDFTLPGIGEYINKYALLAEYYKVEALLKENRAHAGTPDGAPVRMEL